MPSNPTFLHSFVALATAFGLLLSQSAIARENYVSKEGDTYFYQPELTAEEKRQGAAFAYLSGFRYFGMNDQGEHEVVAIDEAGAKKWSAYCPTPCRVIRLSDGRRLASRPSLLLRGVFEDAISGRLRNSNPVLVRTHVPSFSPVRGVSPEGVVITDKPAVNLPADPGSDVFAPASGLVVESGYHPNYGNYVKIDHGSEIISIIGNLRDRPRLKGRIVSPRTVVGKPKGGYAIYEVRIAQTPVNPLPYLFDENEKFRKLFREWQSIDPAD